MLQSHVAAMSATGTGNNYRSRSIRSAATEHSRKWVPNVWHRAATATRARMRKPEGIGGAGRLVSCSDSPASSAKKVAQPAGPALHDLSPVKPPTLTYVTNSNPPSQARLTDSRSKALPTPPGLTLSPGPDSTLVSLSKLSPSVLSAFSKELESRFLSPVEQQVLQSIQWLSAKPTAPATTLVQLGADAFWVSANDANMLHRIDVLTETLSKEEKQVLLRNLQPLLKPMYKYPLTQVLQNGIKIVSIKEEPTKVNDNESLIDLYSDFESVSCKFEPIDESNERFRPPPLKISSKEDTSFSERYESSEKLNPKGMIGEVVDFGNDKLARCKAVDDGLKQPGSVGRARARLVKAAEQATEEARLEAWTLRETNDTNSSTGSRCPPSRELSSNNQASALITAKQPGSVRSALDGLFENPRPAPKPAASVIRPFPQGQPKETYIQPGSVNRAHLAAEDKLRSQPSSHLRLGRSNGRLAQHIRPDATKQPGSVRRAREDLASSTSDAHVKRLASLPLLPIEVRRKNLRAGLSPTFGSDRPHPPGLYKQLSTTSVLTAEPARRQVRNKDPYSFYEGEKDGVLGSLRSSPAQKASIANLRGEICHHSVRPIIDAEQFSILHEQLSGLRGGGNSDADRSSKSSTSLRRSVSALLSGGKLTPLADDECPPKPLWYLAGGRTSFSKDGPKREPTAGELRERRKVEEANREAVGFIGTVFGVRAVRQFPRRPVEEEAEIEREAEGKGIEQ